jgi:hypothetical protein
MEYRETGRLRWGHSFYDAGNRSWPFATIEISQERIIVTAHFFRLINQTFELGRATSKQSAKSAGSSASVLFSSTARRNTRPISCSGCPARVLLPQNCAGWVMTWWRGQRKASFRCLYLEIWQTQVGRQILDEPRITRRSECHLITGDLNKTTIEKLNHDADSADAF